jgi:hypothetical protein
LNPGRRLKKFFSLPLTDARGSVNASESAPAFLNRDCEGAARNLFQKWAGSGFRIVLLFCCVAFLVEAQDIRIFSEFERFDPFGNPVPADRDMVPREILSPAMLRNGHLSVHVVVSGPAGTNYFLYAGTNPPGILQVKIYREHFTRCGDSYCPDWLTEQKSPAFGAIPELLDDFSRPVMNNQTTRSYLLDIFAPAGATPRRVRVEALLKVGTWLVAPMEVRIVAPTVPDDAPALFAEDVAPLDAPASATAEIQLFRYLNGLPPERPRQLLRVRDLIQRNAAEDMLLARLLQRDGPAFPEMNFMSFWPFVYPHFGADQLGAEWYLKVRDFLYRFDP